MAKMLSRVAPWLASRKETAGPGISIRVLSGPDTAELRELAADLPPTPQSAAKLPLQPIP